jgi:hypothetical protein
VRPSDGIELPGVGLGVLSTGVGLGGNPSQASGDHGGGYGLNRPVGGNSSAGIYGNMGSGLQVILKKRCCSQPISNSNSDCNSDCT